MNILIAGASGFIGRELVNSLSKQHRITVIGRTMNKLNRVFPHTIDKLTWNNLATHEADAYHLIINLSGANIGEKRWCPAIKKELIESRTLTNKRLIDWLLKQQAKPRFFCASAVGIYGSQEMATELVDESASLALETADDFLQQIGLAWEASLQPAIDKHIAVTTLRFGVVLKKGQGMLKKLELPFRLGLGPILGNGSQPLSWIHYQDLVNALLFLLEKTDITGPINITSPYPLTQKAFARQFAKVLKRPLFFSMPSWFIRFLFGEMGDYLLLKGQSVYPKRLLAMGFKFTYADLNAALTQEYPRSSH